VHIFNPLPLTALAFNYSHLPNLATHLPKLATHLPNLATHLPKFATHLPDLATHLIRWMAKFREVGG
jgi:hypothetical protein